MLDKRKLTGWVEEIHGAAAARNVAEQYLRRFPRGGYAGAARALLGDR